MKLVPSPLVGGRPSTWNAPRIVVTRAPPQSREATEGIEWEDDMGDVNRIDHTCQHAAGNWSTGRQEPRTTTIDWRFRSATR